MSFICLPDQRIPGKTRKNTQANFQCEMPVVPSSSLESLPHCLLFSIGSGVLPSKSSLGKDLLLQFWFLSAKIRSRESTVGTNHLSDSLWCVLILFGTVSLWQVVVFAFQVAQVVKNLPAKQETRVWSLCQEDPLGKGMATHSSILAWRIPWTEEPGGLQSTRSQRVRPSEQLVRHD